MTLVGRKVAAGITDDDCICNALEKSSDRLKLVGSSGSTAFNATGVIMVLVYWRPIGKGSGEITVSFTCS